MSKAELAGYATTKRAVVDRYTVHVSESPILSFALTLTFEHCSTFEH